LFGIAKELRTFDPADSWVILVQSAPRLLPAFPESLSAIARRSLEKLGIEVLLSNRVDAIDGEGALVGARRIAARTVLWAAAVAASPAAINGWNGQPVPGLAPEAKQAGTYIGR
jgi:NADH dehydrogenase/putative oxidoreductase